MAARASWVIGLGVLLILTTMKGGPTNRVLKYVCLGVSLIGEALAVFALVRARAVGKQGVLGPALLGLILNFIFPTLVIAYYLS